MVLGSKREGLAPAGTVAGSTESHFGEVGGVHCKMASKSGRCFARPPQACDNLRATCLPAGPRLTGRFDIAMLPSLIRVENLVAALAGYEVVLVDECDHVPATSFEMVLRACPIRRVYGLTVTPKRKDRLEKLLFAHCGPLRHALVDAPTDEVRTVKVRHSTVTLPPDAGPRPPIHALWEALVQDESRIKVIVADLLSCAASGCSPLVLADRKVYLERLQVAFIAQAIGVTCHRMGCISDWMVRWERRPETKCCGRSESTAMSRSRSCCLRRRRGLARDSTLLVWILVLAMPLSFKGRLV